MTVALDHAHHDAAPALVREALWEDVATRKLRVAARLTVSRQNLRRVSSRPAQVDWDFDRIVGEVDGLITAIERILADAVEANAELERERDEARAQLATIGRKAFWAAKPFGKAKR